MIESVAWIAFLPLIASLIILFFGKEGSHSKMPFVGLAAMGWCLIHSLIIFYQASTGAISLPYASLHSWFEVGRYPFSLGVLIDGPAAVMLVVVTLVSFLVQLYSLGYMHADPRLKRFYAYVSFFTASMLGLVISS